MTGSIVPLRVEHWPDVALVYRAGIATGHATFETEPPTWERFDAATLPGQRLVAIEDGRLLGWVAASAYSDRAVYRGVVKHSLYVAPLARGHGIGRLLLDALIGSTEAAGIWTIQAGVFPENTASLALHRSTGFRVVGTRERLGRMAHGPMAGRWRDVLLLERRSQVTGTEQRER